MSGESMDVEGVSFYCCTGIIESATSGLYSGTHSSGTRPVENSLWPTDITRNARKNSHRLVGFKIARLLRKTVTMPRPVDTQPISLNSLGRKTSGRMPIASNKTEASAAIPRHQ